MEENLRLRPARWEFESLRRYNKCPLRIMEKYNALLRHQVGVRISEGVQNIRPWCNGSISDSKSLGQGSNPCGRAKINFAN